MSVTVVGALGFESIGTPSGSVEHGLGGHAAHAALAASLLTDVRLASAVGEDFGDDHLQVLEGRGIAIGEVLRVTGERTATWSVDYDLDLQTGRAHATGARFDRWRRWLSPAARESEMLMLAATAPTVQQHARDQWRGEGWAGIETRRQWVEAEREALVEAIRSVDMVFLTGREARILSEKPLVLEAAHEIHSWGPEVVALKLADHGYAVLHEDGYFSVPAHPLEKAVDPTGTGSAFAGGVLGYLDRVCEARLTLPLLRQAASYGAAMASLCAEGLSSRRLTDVTEFEVMRRAADFKPITHFEREPAPPAVAKIERPAEKVIAHELVSAAP